MKTANPTGINVMNLRKTYGSFVALNDVCLDIREGEFLTLLGPSGSGKTSLLNIIAGFVRPDSGKLKFGDDDVTHKPVHERGLGMVFQSYALFPHMSVKDNVAFPLRVRKFPAADIAREVARVLDLVQLGHLADRSVTALSGGQRQRVALARAVVFSPRIVLMDEPLSALDKNLREQMQVEIRSLHKQIGATTIYVTHDQREALTMSDRIAVMNKGEIVQCDTPSRIYEQPANAFVASFIGETALLKISRTSSGIALDDGTELKTAHPIPIDGELVLAMRAEKISLIPEGEGQSETGSEEPNRIPATVREVIYQGDSMLLLAEVAGGQIISLRKSIRSFEDMQLYQIGMKTTLGLPVAATIVVKK